MTLRQRGQVWSVDQEALPSAARTAAILWYGRSQAGFSSSLRRISTQGGAESILLNSRIQLWVFSELPAPRLRN